MKFSIVWYTSLFAAVPFARSDGDRGASAPPALPGWGADGRPARVRRQPRLVPTDQGDKTVVIVGAGYAGWGAAHRLVEGGMAAQDITILEADDTFGGRAQKDEDFVPYPLDTGPSYIAHHFRGEVAELAGVSVEEMPISKVAGERWYLWKDGMTYYDFLAKNIIAKLDLCESKEECRKQAKKMGVDFRGQHSEEGTYGCYSKPNQKKAFWGGGTDEQGYTTDLSGNRERINCDKIQKEYGCWVTSVDYEGADHVETTCDNGKSFTSTQVIVAVPLSVLKDGDIAFTPDLPANIQQNVDERDWWGGFKLFLEFDTDFSPRSLDGEVFDRDPDTELRTGEQLLWDYTRYGAPEFVGRRNVVGGYFVGSMADDFDGMDEAQIVEEVLERFAGFYADGDGYTRGYRPDSYRRHLLVHWDDPAVKPFVRGTYSGPSRTFAGHRADDRNKLFIAGEAFPAPLLEFCRSPVQCYWHLWWREFPEEIQEAYTVLGWSETSWDNDSNYPDTDSMSWDELTGEQREAAAVIGYTQASWDARDAVSAKAHTAVEYESEGWVYSALHSGQKAAEMILALQGWSDLFAAEDFGTFGATLGVFDACGEGDRAKEGNDNFFLELHAREADSCARTQHFDVSGGATKIRIAFKLKAVNFKDGDFFSLDIATNGGDKYTQVLTAGTTTNGDGGTLGSVVIPQNKKWFGLGKLLDGDRKKWMVVKLADLGTGSVESISLRFTNHAAHENNQKVHLDDVSLQEFVPM